MIFCANVIKCEERLHRRCISLPHQTEMMKQAYNELLQRPEWKRKRMEILNRDGHRCKNCGNDKNLQIHHRQYIKYSRTGKHVLPWNYEGRLLVTLCHSCHELGHQQIKIQTKFI